MALDHNEFLRLSRIAESLSRSDPGLARKLAGPTCRASLWTVLCYTTLAVFALLTLASVAICDTTAPSRTIVNSPSHRDGSAADTRPQVHAQVDGQVAGPHARPMRSPVDYGVPMSS
jgi:hypothetical protein